MECLGLLLIRHLGFSTLVAMPLRCTGSEAAENPKRGRCSTEDSDVTGASRLGQF